MENEGKITTSVGELKGVGEVRKKALARMGIVTLRDLICHYPRAYQNRADEKNVGEIESALSESDSFIGSVILTVAATPSSKMIRRGMNVLRFKAFDEYGKVEITYFNQSYLKETFVQGSTFRFWGKVYKEAGIIKMTSPIYEPCVKDIPLRALYPVYSLTSGISQKFMAGIIKEAVEKVLCEVEETVPREICEKYNLMTQREAIYKIHFSQSTEEIEAARRRLSFEEAYIISSAYAAEKYKSLQSASSFDTSYINEYFSALPFDLTNAQKRCIEEICEDLKKTSPMRRILVGDVGSGKTAVAASAAFVAVKNGYQCAVMVPTEILASQHYADFKPFFAHFGINVELLTGSTSASEKKRILEVLSGKKKDLTGQIDIVVGTHALISDNVSFSNLGLVITDEQHRFGVMQRAILTEKSEGVHTLVMSATPIPRTMSLVYYGDLDISKIDEMPPGRQKVDTYVVDERYRERINRFIRTHAKAGNKTYIVCPAVDESGAKSGRKQTAAESDPEEMANYIVYGRAEENKSDLKSTVEFARELSLRLPDLKIGMINGKMKPSQKNAVMNEFSEGELDVLVSTTVIEVGVNVPKATLMIVENAERFGLSQLHQLRGRVGRSDRKSFCILVSDSKSENARRRLTVMKKTYDGYEIAEADLKLRGAGDFFAVNGRCRQHGDTSSFLFGDGADHELVSKAVMAAYETVKSDPNLEKGENTVLKDKISQLRKNIAGTIS